MNSSRAMAMPKTLAPIDTRITLGSPPKGNLARAPPAFNVARRSAAAPRQGSRWSLLSAARVPMSLEIVDQCRAEMAIGLLARIHRHVGSEGVERLLRNAERAAVAGGAPHSGVGAAVDDPGDRCVHSTGLGR